MSKIKVLRVPDDVPTGPTDVTPFARTAVSPGDLVISVNGTLVKVIEDIFKPALLAALLENAGAVKTWATIWRYGPTLIRDTKLEAIAVFDEDFGDCRVTPVWLLSVPEDTP